MFWHRPWVADCWMIFIPPITLQAEKMSLREMRLLQEECEIGYFEIADERVF